MKSSENNFADAKVFFLAYKMMLTLIIFQNYVLYLWFTKRTLEQGPLIVEGLLLDREIIFFKNNKIDFSDSLIIPFTVLKVN